MGKRGELMSDDFGTVNVRRGDRAREIEVLRQHYRQHRDALASLASEAPSEHLADEYQRLVAEIEQSLVKLDELERRGPAVPTPGVSRTVAGVTLSGPPAVPPPSVDPLREPTEPGNRPLVHTPPTQPGGEELYDAPPVPPGNSSRVLLILAAGLVMLAVIGYLAWRASSGRHAETLPIVEQTATTTAPVTEAVPSTAAPVTPAADASPIAVSPALAEYGTIHKGTRATRQFEITNNGTAPIEISVARSQCRCLYYEYTPKIAPKKKESLTVTVDGARAKAGVLRETLQVTAKKNPSVQASFEVAANIQ
jgi:hypothetical protein